MFLPFIFSACSLKTLALRGTASLLDKGADALYEESDPKFAQETMGSQLKLIEALLRNDPDNRKLLVLAAEGFGAYAFLFLQDEQPEYRAKNFYLRGRDYALRALARKPAFQKLADLDAESLERALKSAEKRDAPALFWTAFNWSSWINLSRNSTDAVAQLPKTVLIMKKVSQLQPGYHFAGAELFFGSYYASRPAILGGDIKKAKAHFAQAHGLTGGLFLMAYVLEARYYAVAAQDQTLYKELLEKVRLGQAGALPKARLSDEVAKIKAAQLLSKTDEYF
ncbi:MAG: hypothetical protein A3J74_09055 [Elusimicrobia bacterium RIFCSPHIGHO2_02_FULL_57_9]|nr:MAG: hypothetical protein A3J74_09055 [Elusimicrobia bacterium RIFCSPHIGHO2_02_FULL_57_9]